jgi:hypothetical protein
MTGLITTGIFPRFNIRVTAAAMNEPRSESALVVDPRNPNRLLGASKHFYDPQKYIFSLSAVFSEDGGDTWEDLPAFPIPVNHIIYTDPSATFGTPSAPGMASPAWVMGDPGFSKFPIIDGPNLFELFECAAHGQTDDILTSQMLAQQSIDDGATWTEHEIVALRCTGDDKGWIACDNSTLTTGKPKPKPLSPYHGRLYAVWAAETPMRFARSLDGGKTWIGAGSAKAGDNIGLQATEGPDISISRNGTVHLFAHRPDTFGIDYQWSADGGETFQGATFVANSIGDIHKNIDNQNIKWAGSPGSAKWPVFDGANFRVITLVSSCCFGDAGIMIAWADARSKHSRIFYRLSYDNGATWQGDPSGTPLLPDLNDDSHQFHPQLAVTGNGVIGCAMYSYSKTARPGNKPGIDVLVAGSFDQGTTWELKTVTEQPWDPAVNAPWSHGDSKVTFIGEYFGFDAGAKEFHVLWTDTRDGNQDLYYCRVDTENYNSPVKDIVAEIEATLVSPGVPRGGDGFVVVNGHVIRVPPHEPLRPVLDAVVAIKTASEIGRLDTTRATQALCDVMINAAKLAKRDLTSK